jgi:hypothetical protein
MSRSATQPYLQRPSTVEIAFAPSAVRTTTEDLLRGLQGSPTDLAKLVTRVHQRRRRVVAVSANAITRWDKDDAESWARVREWLTMQGVRIVKI